MNTVGETGAESASHNLFSLCIGHYACGAVVSILRVSITSNQSLKSWRERFTMSVQALCGDVEAMRLCHNLGVGSAARERHI